jgi:hypothetical protein
MSDRRIRRWALLGALVSTALLTQACEQRQGTQESRQGWPKEGSDYEGVVNEGQKNEGPDAIQQGEQQPGTGGSGRSQQQDPRTLAQQQGGQQPIGAPGVTAPLENPDVGKNQLEPVPRKTELGGADKAGEREMTPPLNR